MKLKKKKEKKKQKEDFNLAIANRQLTNFRA